MDFFKNDRHFEIVDYLVFSIMLIISAVIGIYFAFFSKIKQNTTQEYLMGGKTLGIFPISMSLISSYISGISILGKPAEMYTYGTQYWITVFAEPIVGLVLAFCYLPVFYKLQITSSYEYLKLRFNSTVRLLGSVLFLIKMLLYIPIVIYVPALSFSQVTGINLHLVTPIVCIVCIFYTTLGGLKAVVWTDTVQTIIMFGSLIFVVAIGTSSVGGFSEVWKRNQQGKRIEFFNMDPNPTIRHSFWTVTIGRFFAWLASCSVNQAMVQRCLAMPSLHSARITIALLVVGVVLLITICCYIGLIIYATYHKCDPITKGSILKPDQLLPYFVMQIDAVPGLPGLFVSGVFSAALSSMSTGLNSMTGVIYEDLIKPRTKNALSEAKASLIMKIIVVLIGLICIGLVFVIENMNTALIQISGSLASITAGPLLGIFSLGMFFPQANSQGALFGGLVGGAVLAWINAGAQMSIAQGLVTYPKKPVSIEQCFGNLSIVNSTITINEEIFFLYRISYMYYTPLGTCLTLIIGLIISYATGCNKTKPVHPDLISPAVHRFKKKQDNGDKEMS